LKRGGILLAGLAVLLVIGLAAVLMVVLGRPDYTPRETRPTVEQETRRLETELPLAASRMPYLVVDLLSSRIIYRISGLSPKTIPFRIDSIRGKQGRMALAQEGQSLLVLQGRGAPREIIKPPDPNQPVDPLKDPKIFPPDPPKSYTLSFEGPVTIEIVGEKEGGWKDRLATFARSFRKWLGRGRGNGKVQIRLRLPAARAQEIYRGLYRGEKVLLLGLEEPAPVVASDVKGG
jgi:hypothetical protein